MKSKGGKWEDCLALLDMIEHKGVEDEKAWIVLHSVGYLFG